MTPEEQADVRRAVLVLSVASQQLRQEANLLACAEPGSSTRLTHICTSLIRASDALARHVTLDETGQA